MFLLSRHYDNYFIRALTARCEEHVILNLETCLRGCPIGRGTIGPGDLASAKRVLENFDVILFHEALPTHSQKLGERAHHQLPRLEPADEDLVRATVTFDDQLYSWARARRAACAPV